MTTLHVMLPPNSGAIMSRIGTLALLLVADGASLTLCLRHDVTGKGFLMFVDCLLFTIRSVQLLGNRKVTNCFLHVP